MGLSRLFRSKLECELDDNRDELADILGDEEPGQRIDRLRSFANRIGASTIKLVPGYGLADEPELLRNVHTALQTKAMIAAVKTTSNYVVVSVILALIAFVSMISSIVILFR